MPPAAASRVFLLEQGDLAGATSSASTKLIHGGLRYLEHYEFRLVREALVEREVLLEAAPHIIRPHALRPAASQRACGPGRCSGSACSSMTISAAARILPPTRTLDLARDPAGRPLKPDFAARLRIFRLLGR